MFVVVLVAGGSAHAATITQIAEVMSKLGADLAAIGNATGTVPRVSACSSLAADGRVLLGDQRPADVPPLVWRRVRGLARIAVRDGTQCTRDGTWTAAMARRIGRRVDRATAALNNSYATRPGTG